MIRAHHTLAGALLARVYAGPLLDGAFRRVRIAGEGIDRGRPLLMLANHFCWWDGFIQYRIDRMCFHRTLYVMMLEEQLQRHPVLTRCGCFSVKRNSRSLLETLDYCAEILRAPQNMLLVFPQGEIRSIHSPTLAFRAGAGRLVQRLGSEFDLVLNVNLPDYGIAKKPALDCYWKIADGREYARPEALEAEANRFYAACKARQNALLR